MDTSSHGPGDFARYALSIGWDPIPLHGVNPDGSCTCHKGKVCPTPGKHPENEQWPRRPKVDPMDTYAMWDTASHPVNVGIKTGRPSGFFVLDVDPDAEGDLKLQALVDEHGPLPKTRQHRTGSGGVHYLFTLPDFEIGNSRGRLPRGLDIRGTGGMVVAPGSVSKKGAYSTLDPSEIVPAPAWLLDLIRPKSRDDLDFEADKVPSTPYAELDAASQKRSDQYRDAIIAGEVGRLDAMRQAAVASSGNIATYRGEPWNETTFMVACNLLEVAQSDWMDFTPLQARELLEAHAPQDSGFGISEIRTCLRSAAARVRGNARVMPDTILGGNPTWDLLAAGVPERNPGKAGGGDAAQPEIPVDEDGRPLWRVNKNGSMSLNVGVLASMIKALGPLRTDDGGGFWYYENGVYTFSKNVIRDRCVMILDDAYSRESVGKAGDHIAATSAHISLNDVAHPDLINFRNTMVHWRTGQAVPHDADLGSTFQIATRWDPNAQCPLFDQWVSKMLSPSAAALLWQVIGYSMLPHNPQQIFVFLDGPGGNGKGVILRLITELLGAGNVSALSITQIDGGNQFALSSMIGKAANISGETPVKYVEDSSNLKGITGGDWLRVERKGSDPFMAKIHALPIFSVNDVPRMADDSDGFLQRAVVIPFHNSARENKVTGFTEEALISELPGIARKAMEALRTVRMDDLSLRSEAFAIDAEDIRQTKAAFEEATNSELEWVRNYVRPKKDHWVTSMELYKAFGGRNDARPSRKFMKTLRTVFGEPKRRVPTSATMFGDGTKRDLCYEVEFSTAPYSGLHAVPDDALEDATYAG